MVLTLKGSEVSLSYVQCFLYLLCSSINVSIFHIIWLNTFWTDLVIYKKILVMITTITNTKLYSKLYMQKKFKKERTLEIKGRWKPFIISLSTLCWNHLFNFLSVQWRQETCVIIHNVPWIILLVPNLYILSQFLNFLNTNNHTLSKFHTLFKIVFMCKYYFCLSLKNR